MAIETWLPALLGYLIPTGVFLLAWGGMEPRRARRAATVGLLALALAVVGYFATGFAFHLGGAGWMSDDSALAGLRAILGRDGDADWGMIGLTGFFLAGGVEGDPLTPEALALFVNYVPLVATSVLLVVLSVHGRARAWQMALGGLLVGAVLFPIAACWAWGGGWLAHLGLTVERGHGFVDHAGSGVVYWLGGLAALGALLGLGQRLPRRSRDEPAPMPPAHFPLLANLGALLFGLGLLGWSMSAPFHAAGADVNWPRAAINMLTSAAGGILAVQVYSYLAVGHADGLMSARGGAAGFIAIAAGAPFVPPWAALLIGVLAGVLLPLGVFVVERIFRLPDATATVALGVTAGLVGLLAVAVFADGLTGQGWNGVGAAEYQTEAGKGVTGFFPAGQFQTGDGRGQLIAQLAGSGAIGALAFLFGLVTFYFLNLPYTRPWEAWGVPEPAEEPESEEDEPELG